MSSRHLRLVVLACAIFSSFTPVPLALANNSTGTGGGTAPFQIVDNVEGSFVNLNHFAVRPIVAHPSGSGFFALNTHASTVEVFDDTSSAPIAVWDVPWGPVAARLWTNSSTRETSLLVSCRGSRLLARLDITSGEILELTPLPAEPADLLVLDGDIAFVACSSLDTVVQIDLLSGAKIEYSPTTHPNFNCKNPVFLAKSNSGKVFVAPMHSGNNSTASRRVARQAGTVLDLNDPTVAVQGLPDEDLFLINPVTHVVLPAATGVGTTLFGFEINPVTTRTWVLNTEANNKGAMNQGEAAVRGRVVANRLSILRANTSSPLPVPDLIVDLDDSDPVTPGTQYHRPDSVAQPFGLGFRADGHGYIVGLGTDNVVELDENGFRLSEFNLPNGSIPRALVVNDAAGVFWVYCWGSNQVREYQISDSSLIRVCQLSVDPTPPNIAAGRELFYDAGHSFFNNGSCASCHVEGRTDFLVWNLEQTGVDDKGPLLTQSMTGLAPLAPFHWRGERKDLAEFNGAFDDLLGGTPLSREDLADFQAFVLSLTNPANPYSTRERELDDSKIPNSVANSASAIAGQVAYFNTPISTDRFCNSCHALPTGTNHHIFGGEPSEVVPKRVFNKVVPFNQTFRRLTSKVPIETYIEPGNPGAGTLVDNRGYLGVAATHAGLIEDFTTRISDFFSGPVVDDLTSFVMQLDTGVAPAIHQAFLLDASTLVQSQPELENYLMPMAAARHCDVVVIGRSEPGAVHVRWAWERSSNMFIPDSSTLTPRTLADFIANAGSERHVFYGLPVGMARRQMIDLDLDGLVNSKDPQPATPAVDSNDTTAPVFVQLPTLKWATTSTARLQFETNEPTVYRITYGEGLHPDRCEPKSAECDTTSDAWSQAHTPLLTEMQAGTAIDNGIYVPVTFSYAPVVEVFDRAGNTTSFTMPSFDSLPHGPASLDDVIVGRLFWQQFDDHGPGPLQARADIQVLFKHGAPPQPPVAQFLVACRILVDGVPNDTWVPVGPGVYRVDEIEWQDQNDSKVLDVSGPLLVSSETDLNGMAHVAFEIPGLSVGQKVTINLESVFRFDTSQRATLYANLDAANNCATSGGPPPCRVVVPVTFFGRAGTRWSMPDTKKRRRTLTEPFDPLAQTQIPLF
ncbi:MAG: hypothetical protein ACI9F9_000027 [Candidatus Paceibacteria bacterium]|jgi:hypothetical protein